MAATGMTFFPRERRRMSRARVATIALTVAIVGIAAAAACGGNSGAPSSGGAPKLAGTAIPTVPLPTPTEVVCSPPAQLAIPANFPAEIPLPPDYQVWSVTTSPNLIVIGRTTPSITPGSLDVPRGVVARDLLTAFVGRGWTPKLNQVDGRDYNLTSPDGRILHFNAIERPECGGIVQLTFDVKWVTP